MIKRIAADTSIIKIHIRNSDVKWKDGYSTAAALFIHILLPISYKKQTKKEKLISLC